jgi:hypothetical protein
MKRRNKSPFAVIRTCWTATAQVPLCSIVKKMSSNSFASGSKSTDGEVDGYIHNVSDIHVAKSGTRYFDFSVQQNERQTHVVCFSPEKRSMLKEREHSRSPVTLANISPQKRKYDTESTEYSMNKYSRVINKKNLSFP